MVFGFCVFRKVKLLRKYGRKPTLPLAGVLSFLFPLANLLSLVGFELLSLSVESLLGFSTARSYLALEVPPGAHLLGSQERLPCLPSRRWLLPRREFPKSPHGGCSRMRSAVRAASPWMRLPSRATPPRSARPAFPAESKNFLVEEFKHFAVVFAKVPNRAEVWLLVRR